MLQTVNSYDAYEASRPNLLIWNMYSFRFILMKFLVLLGFLIQAFISLGQTGTPISQSIFSHTITDALKPITLKPNWILVEGDTALNIERLLAGDFADAQRQEIDSSYTIMPSQGYWIGLQLSVNQHLDQWLLYLEDPTSDRGLLHGYSYIDVFIQDSLGLVRQKKAGSLVPRSQREIKSRHTLNRISLRLSPASPIQIWIHIHRQLLPKPFPVIKLINPHFGGPRYNHRLILALVASASIFAILFIIGIVLFRVSKDRIYACFSLYTGIQTTQAIMILPHNPLGEWVFVENPLYSLLVSSATASLYVYGYIQFSLDLIDAKKHSPQKTKWLQRYALYSIIYAWVTAFFILFTDISYLSLIMSGYLLFFITGTVLFLLLSINRDRTVRFVGGVGVFFFGSYILINIMSSTGQIDPVLNLPILLLIALAPALMGVFAMVFHFQQSEADKAETRRLAELDVVKTRLYTNITHEFRTPLTVIRGMSDKVREKPERWLHKGMKAIKRNSQYLLRLVNQLLALTKLESGHLRLQTSQVDILSHSMYLLESYQSYADLKEIHLSYNTQPDELEIYIDVQRFSEIVSNLLSNAVKFTAPGGQVTVNIHTDTTHFYLEVIDNGIGIPAAALPRIFDRFFQVESTNTRTNEGTGIGLALSKELAELMGGALRAESVEGEGSTFTLTLPLHPPYLSQSEDIPARHDAAVAIPTESYTEAYLENIPTLPLEDRPQVLIIEDNPDIVQYLIACLEDDYQLIHAKDGESGIQLALQEVPALIISDVMMPRKDGYEVCYTLKRHINTSHIPIILLTARADMDSKLSGLRQGADAYLIKPFYEKELHAHIKKLLTLRDALQAYYTQREAEASNGVSPSALQEDFLLAFKKVVFSELSNPKLDVNMVCGFLHLSRTPLHNKIKALTGMSTTEFIRYIRLGEAAKLLSSTTKNISEIAYECGFRTPNYFSRVFREHFGLSPKQYREGGKPS